MSKPTDNRPRRRLRRGAENAESSNAKHSSDDGLNFLCDLCASASSALKELAFAFLREPETSRQRLLAAAENAAQRVLDVGGNQHGLGIVRLRQIADGLDILLT